MPNPNPNIEVTVVVSGQSATVKANIHQKVENLVRDALNQTGNQGQPPANWELRTSDGILIDQNLTIQNAGIVQGMKLFLSPHAGAGGN